MGQVTQTTAQVQAVLTAVGNLANVSPTNNSAVIPTAVLTDAFALKANVTALPTAQDVASVITGTDTTQKTISAQHLKSAITAVAGGSYTLPTSSTTVLGGVKVDGTTVTINGSGVISSAGGGGAVNLTGDVTSVGAATTLTNSAVIAKVLTGFVSATGVIAATDSILAAVQKLAGNIALLASLASPTFTGDPKAPTPLVTDSDTSVATTAFVKNQNANIITTAFYRSDNVVAVSIPVVITINAIPSTGLVLTKNATGQILSLPAPDAGVNASITYDRSASVTSPISQGNVVASTQTQNRKLNIGATAVGVTNILQTRTITRNSRKEIITISAWITV